MLSSISSLSLSRLRRRRREQFDGHSKPIVDDDDGDMADGAGPTLNDIEQVEREFREIQKRRERMLRLSDDAKRRKTEQAKRLVSVGTRFAGKRGARRRKKSAFGMSSSNTTSWGSCRVFCVSKSV